MNPLLPFEWIAALRFMREGLAQTLLIVIGVIIGTSVIVFMSAALSNLQTNILRRALNSLPQISIIPPDEVSRPLRTEDPHVTALVQPRAQRLRSIDQWQKAMKIVQQVPGVVAQTPVVSGPAYALRGDASRSVSVTGIELESYTRVISLGDKMIAGSLRLSSLDIVIGTELAKDLGVAVGDKLALTSPAISPVTLTVSGIFDFGNKAVNQRNVYVALRVAQNLLDLAGGVSSINVNAADPFDAENVAQVIQARTQLEADSWIKTNPQFFTAMTLQTLTNRLIRLFVGVTVALGITSVLIVSVIQKSREIGILRAMGTSRGQVLRVFLIQGGVMALLGALPGSALGWAFLAIWKNLARNPDGTPIFILEVSPLLFVTVAVGATLVGVLAAAMPARNASRLDPVVAIRG